MTPKILLIGIGLAMLLPVVPFALEMLALRRLTTAAFGTLMALEPGFAMIVGFVDPASGAGTCSASSASAWSSLPGSAPPRTRLRARYRRPRTSARSDGAPESR